MSKIDDDSLMKSISFLTFEDLISVSECNRHFYYVTSQNSLWETLYANDFGACDSDQTNPPGEFEISAPNFKTLYMIWKRTFKEYEVADVKFVRLWWRKFEILLRSIAPIIYSTIGNSLSQGEIYDIGNVSKVPLSYPKYLKLLYSFHDGQATADRSKDSSYFSGIFGGYFYYQEFCCMIFLPLRKVCAIREPHSRQLCYVFSECSIQGPRRRIGCTDSGDVYVSSGCRNLRLCHPPPRTESGQKIGLFLWLEVYLNRLQAGLYKYVPSPYVSKMLSHFADGDSFGDQNTIISSCQLSTGTVVKYVTSGIEVTASVVFVPEKSSVDNRRLFWTYNISLRLLENHPTRPASLRKCQLRSRHWKIEFPDRVIQEVVGDGVIGLQPILDIYTTATATTSDSHRSFCYQSCTEGETYPGKMYGTFTFVPGTLAAPAGPDILATIPTFSLTVPTFVY